MVAFVWKDIQTTSAEILSAPFKLDLWQVLVKPTWPVLFTFCCCCPEVYENQQGSVWHVIIVAFLVTTDQPTFYRDGNKGWWHDWCIHVNTRILWWTKNNFYLAIVNQTPFQFLTIWHIGGERDPSSRLHVWSPCSSWHWLPTWIKSDLPRVLISSRIMRSRNFWTGTFPIE